LLVLGLIAVVAVVVVAATAGAAGAAATGEKEEAMTTLEYFLTESKPMLSNEDDFFVH
jgi:hypothetical protein